VSDNWTAALDQNRVPRSTNIHPAHVYLFLPQYASPRSILMNIGRTRHAGLIIFWKICGRSVLALIKSGGRRPAKSDILGLRKMQYWVFIEAS